MSSKAAESHSVPSGVYNYDQLQHFLSTRKADLSELSLDALLQINRAETVELSDLNIEVPEGIRRKRLETVRESQSNEPFRPFMELIINSLDYARGDHPHLVIRVAEVIDPQTKTSLGWQIVIQDKPIGLGMTSDQLLNNYIELYSSGSAQARKTPTGRWKRGMMGIGSKQKDSLLQNPDFDRIMIASTPENETQKVVIATLKSSKTGEIEQDNTQIEIALGGFDLTNDVTRRDFQVGSRNVRYLEQLNAVLLGKKLQPIDISAPTRAREKNFQKPGVMQVIRVSHSTCQNIHFSPENFVAYLSERLGAIHDATIDVKVTREFQPQTQTLDLPGVTPTFAESLNYHWQKVHDGKKEQQLGTKTITEYRVTPETSLDFHRMEFPDEGISIRFANQLTNPDHPQVLVYLNVLGVRVGDPLLVTGQNLPEIIDLTFLEPIETIAEGRTSVGLTQDMIRKLRRLILFDTPYHVTPPVLKIEMVKAQLLRAITPVLEAYEQVNQWQNIRELCLQDTLKMGWSRQIEEWESQESNRFSFASGNEYFSIPYSFLEKVGVPQPNKILAVPDQYFDQLQTRRFLTEGLAQGLFKRVEGFEPQIYSCSLPLTEVLWVSPFGVLFINEKLFPYIGQIELLQIKAILMNRADAHQLTDSFSLKQSTQEAQAEKRTVTIENIAEQERFEQGVHEFEHLQAQWETLSLTDKKQAINHFFKTSVPPSIWIKTSDNGYLVHSTQGESLTPWYELNEPELEIWWKILQKIITSQVSYLRDSEKANFFTTTFSSVSHWYDQALTSDILFQVDHPYFYKNAYFFKTGHINPAFIRYLYQARVTVSEFGLVQFFHGLAHSITVNPDLLIANLTDLEENDQQALRALLTDENRVAHLLNHLSFNHEPRIGGHFRLVAQYPHEIVYLEKLYEKYTSEIVSRALAACSEQQTLITPQKLFNIILPLLEAYQVKIQTPLRVSSRHTSPDGVVTVTHELVLDNFLSALSRSEESARRDLTEAEFAVWQIIHSETSIAITPEAQPLALSSSSESLDPSLLVWAKLRGLDQQLLDAADIYKELDQLRAQLSEADSEKLKSRKAELLHSPLHHENTPGSSYFELLLNSLQAAERQDLHNSPIEVSDFLATTEGQNFYSFKVRDHVGMDPREALFKLIVPGFGEGKWGMKFLTLLRDVDLIEVQTSVGGKIGTIHILAQRDADGGLQDFQLQYAESDNQDPPLIGTEVRGYKAIQPGEFIQRAGVFRVRISDFSRTISPTRAQISLNNEVLNTVETNYITQEIPDFGLIEVKAGTKGKILVSINDGPPITTFDEKSFFMCAGLADTPISTSLTQAGFHLNVRNCTYPYARDGSGFEKPALATNYLAESLRGEGLTKLVKQMLTTGTLPLDNLLPSEVWRDPRYAQMLSEDVWANSVVNWHNQEEVEQFILTAPIFQPPYATLAKVMTLVFNAETTPNLLITLPSWVKKKVVNDTISTSSEKTVESQLLPEFDYSEMGFLHDVVLLARKMYGLPESPPYSIRLTSHTKKVFNNTDANAWYAHPGEYSWHRALKPKLKKARQGNRSALIFFMETAVHEVGHEDQSLNSRGFFAHDDAFYASVEKAILSGKEHFKAMYELVGTNTSPEDRVSPDSDTEVRNDDFKFDF